VRVPAIADISAVADAPSLYDPESGLVAGDSSERIVVPYDAFLAERRALVDARQRAQQRVDQLVSGGAAGALVLSITFINGLTSTPTSDTKLLLIAAWSALGLSLSANFVSHFASQRAFENSIDQWDAALSAGASPEGPNLAKNLAHGLAVTAAVAFVIGIALLGVFTFLNLEFV
jgi:hypothetical protein